jgi:hypothetical protein
MLLGLAMVQIVLACTRETSIPILFHNALHLQICPALYAVLDKQSAEVLDFPAGRGVGLVLDSLIHERCVQLLASRYRHQWAQPMVRGVA